MESNPALSIIIPSYNEELRLPPSLGLIADYINKSGRDTEVLVVDDGSTDQTAAVAETFRARIPQLRVVPNGENRGKGYSVRHGMTEARGDIVLFTDADLSAPIEEADKLLAALADHDVAIGSRAPDRSPVSVRPSGFREYAGIAFYFLVRFLLRLP